MMLFRLTSVYSLEALAYTANLRHIWSMHVWTPTSVHFLNSKLWTASCTSSACLQQNTYITHYTHAL